MKAGSKRARESGDGSAVSAAVEEEKEEQEAKHRRVVESKADDEEEAEKPVPKPEKVEKASKSSSKEAVVPKTSKKSGNGRAKGARTAAEAAADEDFEEEDEEEDEGGEKDGEEDSSNEEEDEEEAGEEALKEMYTSYDPVSDAGWKQGEDVPFGALAGVFAVLESNTKRLVIQEVLCNFFRSVIALSPGDLVTCLYLSCNELAPAFEGVELGIGEGTLLKAVANATGRQMAHVKAVMEKTGDLGAVAEQSRAKQRTLFKPKPLSCRKVLSEFRAIAKEAGQKSMDKKIQRIKGLLVAAGTEAPEARYIVRALNGKLRIRVASRTVHVALAHAVAITPPNTVLDAGFDALTEPVAPSAGGDRETFAKQLDSRMSDKGRKRGSEKVAEELEQAATLLKQVICEVPSYDVVVPWLLTGGVECARQKCGLAVGVPVAPMLAKPTKGISEVLDRFSDTSFTCEFKYDGERAQVHAAHGASVRIFSRNSEETTGKYPDVAAMIREAAKPGTDSFVLDGEVVAFDTATNSFLPFQQLSTRKRKDVTEETVTMKVIYCAFDLLYLNGQSLIREPFRRRRELLHASFQALDGRFDFAKGKDSSDTEEISSFLTEAIEEKCEGLMVKTLDDNASYEPSKRSLNWLKVKKDYVDGLSDSIDLVPVGAWIGKGKRTGWFGAFLLACYNDEDDEFQTVTKIGTGFSESDLARMAAYFRGFDETYQPGEKEGQDTTVSAEAATEHESDAQGPHTRLRTTKPSNLVHSGDPRITPDVWFEPSIVWEVRAADISISPVHRAALGLVDPSKGLALRFPRFLRARLDKNPEQATNAEQIATMYKEQPVVKGNKSAAAVLEDW